MTTQFSNALISSTQLEAFLSRPDNVSREQESSIHLATTRLIQAIGIVNHLPQDSVATAIVLLQRYWCSPDGPSVLDHDPVDVGVAAFHLANKSLDRNVSLRRLLLSAHSLRASKYFSGSDLPQIDQVFSQAYYDSRRDVVFTIEADICRVLGFELRVVLPYTLCVNYLQTLDIFTRPSGSKLARHAFCLLNTALFSSQLLYLTHQPSALAVAAIYLAARDVGVKLPETEWWEVFDVDREELGFLVVAIQTREKQSTEYS